MRFVLTAAFAALFGGAFAGKDATTFAVLRFTNKQLTQGRADPIVFPGEVSSHVHTVMGGSGFGLNSTGEDLKESKCSNAMIKGDNSNYWFPSLYFQDPKNGSFEPVEVFYVNAYYFFEKSNDDIKAFPLGMAMVSGNATTRIVPEAGTSNNLDPSKGPVNPVRWSCPRLDRNYDPPNWPRDSDGTMAGMGDAVDLGVGVGFPDQDCDGYASPLRADIHFPSCYDPKAGLKNYAENMVWPTDNNGRLDCPEGYIHVPHIFLEVYWNTPVFKQRWEQGKGRQPFVLSEGDCTGYSSHADFMAGWDEELLQHIIDTCNKGTEGMDKCPGLTYGLNKEDCSISSPVDERVDGVLDKLPGDNPVTGWWNGLDDSGSGEGSDNGNGGSNPEASLPVASFPASSKAPESGTISKVPNKTIASPDVTPTAVSQEAIEESGHATSTLQREQIEPSKPATGLDGNHDQSSCSPQIHTIWETVTVTASETAAPSANSHLRRHIHHHARKHGGLYH